MKGVLPAIAASNRYSMPFVYSFLLFSSYDFYHSVALYVLPYFSISMLELITYGSSSVTYLEGIP